ncbi:Selenoprotein O [Paragonimus heterotremus]|uniref:Selenoprotein O n=1 Tax=Paragonimus heterotremus TaxID=100268 RepID=A0A8J4WFU7_9TREM|nr:Selenoprotein O [Paragonimus heterotremus]
MSIIGLTIDYGPFGFMDRFTWDSVCNASDTDGRYSYAQQPSICAWNCARLAECLVRATLDATLSSAELQDTSLYQDKQSKLMKQFHDVLDVSFMSTFKRCYVNRMRKKLGLFASPADDSVDEKFFKSLFDTMEQTGTDFTNTFLALEESLESVPHSEIQSHNVTLCTDPLVAECCSLDELIEFYEPNDSDVKQGMLLRIIGFDRRVCDRLNETKVLKPTEKAVRLRELQHMTEEEKRDRDAHLWRTWLDAYAERLSLDANLMPSREWCERLHLMRSSNPRIVLRNYMAEEAIKAAESGNFTVARNLLEDLRRPFHITSHPDEIDGYNKQTSVNNQLPPQLSSCSRVSGMHGRVRPPAWARELRVT